jgi:hypothetical protein
MAYFIINKCTYRIGVDERGKDVVKQVYPGETFPDDVPEDEIKRLLKAGRIKEI